MTRRYCTASDLRALLEKQHGVCASPNCMSEGPFEADHSTCVAYGNNAKPDQLLCIPCHRKKTFGLRGDISTIAKTKRLANKRTQYDDRKAAGGTRIPARPWQWRGLSKTDIRSKGQ